MDLPGISPANLVMAISGGFGKGRGVRPIYRLMKNSVTLATILLILLCAALLAPQAAPFAQPIAIAALLVAVVAMILSLGIRTAPAEAPRAAAEAVKPAPQHAASARSSGQAEVVTLLSVFQEKGRFIDFLMDEITPYTDAQVGSVVRAVHQGCKAALNEHFTIEPIAEDDEGSEVRVPEGYSSEEIRLVGNLSGEAPFVGELVHKGWRVTSVKLPRVLHPDEDHLPALAPAQIELK